MILVALLTPLMCMAGEDQGLHERRNTRSLSFVVASYH